MIRASRLPGIAMILCGALGIGACRTAPIHNVTREPLALAAVSVPMEDAAEGISRAARVHGWKVEDVDPGVIILTKHVGGHGAAVTVNFDSERYSITHRNSTLKRKRFPWSREEEVHKLYNEWVGDLSEAIGAEFTGIACPTVSTDSSPPGG